MHDENRSRPENESRQKSGRTEETPLLRRGPDLTDREGYDPLVPDQAHLQDLEKENPGFDESIPGRAEHFESTRGEELRPKDGSLDPSSAR